MTTDSKRAVLAALALAAVWAGCGSAGTATPAASPVTSGIETTSVPPPATAVPTAVTAPPAEAPTAEASSAPPGTSPAAETPAESTGTTAGAAPGEPRGVAFDSPAEGAEVASPVPVCLRVRGVTLAPSTDRTPGVGHFLVMTDPSSQEIRRVSADGAPAVPPGPRFIHFDDGGACHDIELEPGHHALLGVIVDSTGAPINPQATARLQLVVTE